jgi:hypothetical protein
MAGDEAAQDFRLPPRTQEDVGRAVALQPADPRHHLGAPHQQVVQVVVDPVYFPPEFLQGIVVCRHDPRDVVQMGRIVVVAGRSEIKENVDMPGVRP